MTIRKIIFGWLLAAISGLALAQMVSSSSTKFTIFKAGPGKGKCNTSAEYCAGLGTIEVHSYSKLTGGYWCTAYIFSGEIEAGLFDNAGDHSKNLKVIWSLVDKDTSAIDPAHKYHYAFDPLAGIKILGPDLTYGGQDPHDVASDYFVERGYYGDDSHYLVENIAIKGKPRPGKHAFDYQINVRRLDTSTHTVVDCDPQDPRIINTN